MGILKKLFGRTQSLNGEQLARSPEMADYAQIALLAEFATPHPLHPAAEQQRWSRVLPQSYADTLERLRRQGWLETAPSGEPQASATGLPYATLYQERMAAEKTAVLPKVRRALAERDTSEALSLRRTYEALFPLGHAGWTGPEPQLSHSALTRRILFLDHWLLDGIGKPSIDWLKLYAAEQHLWGAYWRLAPEAIPESVRQELARPEMDAVEAAYCKAYSLALYVDNHETWQRCKGGDHVRRLEITGPDDEYTCTHCRQFLGKEFLVARVPELPHRACTSSRGCRCRYEPVLEILGEVEA